MLKQETEVYDTLTTTTRLAATVSQDRPQVHKTEKLRGEPVKASGATQLLNDDSVTELTGVTELVGNSRANTGAMGSSGVSDAKPKQIDFDARALEGRYILEEEIHGGGMSRVFLARNAKLGNKWIVKFISNRTGELANEENILKLLNHISLPKIIDIFQDDKGIYLVESFIEGMSLDKVLGSGQKLTQTVIIEWAEQIAQVLSYLHRMEPHPVYHLDMKPSNIMVTHDNRLVLIDFGISKRYGEDNDQIAAVTYNYAAPEQLKHRIPEKNLSLIENRFGTLPADRLYWTPDGRTDIFGLGVILFEMAVGQIPTIENIGMLKENISGNLSKIIMKCMATNPNDRFQSAAELMTELHKLKGSRMKMARTLFMRKFSAVTAAVSVLASGGSFLGGNYIYNQESMSTLEIAPQIVTVSLQQSTELEINKETPDNRIFDMNPDQIKWSFSGDDIVRIDGRRVSGINTGSVEVSGKYRNKTVTLNVNVVEPMDGVVEISQRYEKGRFTEIFAGSEDREQNDGSIDEAEFTSPESIDISEDGTIYLSDSGTLRRISNGMVESISFEPSYLTPRIVRCYKNEVFILTHEWEDEDGMYYGIIHLTDEGAQGLYMGDALYTAVEDFDFSSDGLLYFIDRNQGAGAVYLKTLNTKDIEDVNTLCELPEGTSALTMDNDDYVYLSNPTTGAILKFKDGKLSNFAGIENERKFIDGKAPLFYEPQRIKCWKNNLYVWDFNTLRQIIIVDGVAGEAITVAGEASPEFDLELPQGRQNAESIILPNSRLMDFSVSDKGILITDPKRGVIWQVE
jgi:serine/threonine protein kinase